MRPRKHLTAEQKRVAHNESNRLYRMNRKLKLAKVPLPSIKKAKSLNKKDLMNYFTLLVREGIQEGIRLALEDRRYKNQTISTPKFGLSWPDNTPYPLPKDYVAKQEGAL